MIRRWRVLWARVWWGDPAEATLGRRGERAAAKLLRAKGYRLIARNKRLHAGEADLLMWAPRRAAVVLVEVKTRMVDPGKPQPPPEASVHAHKRAKLVQLAGLLSRQPRFGGVPMRIDVVAVEWPRQGRPVLRHWVDAVR